MKEIEDLERQIEDLERQLRRLACILGALLAIIVIPTLLWLWALLAQ